jgi:nicotinamidase-related amidase
MSKYEVNKIYGEWTWHGGGEIEPAGTALIIIDMQVAFCYPESGYRQAIAKAFGRSLDAWGERMRLQVIPNTARVLEAFREHDLRVVHITTGAWTEDRSDLPPRFRDFLNRLEQHHELNYIFGSPELEIIEELTPRKGEVILRKATGSAFLTTRLDQALRDMGIRYIVLTGISSDGCVLATAIDGYDYGYKETLISDASTTYDPDTHDLICALYKTNWGRALTADQIIEEIRQQAG